MSDVTPNPVHDRMTKDEARELRAFNRYKLHSQDDPARIRKLAAIVDEIERRLVRRIAALERRVYELSPGPDREPGSRLPRRHRDE